MNIVVSLLNFIRKQKTKRAAQLVIRPETKTTLYTVEYKLYLKESSIPQSSTPVSLITRLAIVTDETEGGLQCKKKRSPQKNNNNLLRKEIWRSQPSAGDPPLNPPPSHHGPSVAQTQSGCTAGWLTVPPVERIGNSSQELTNYKSCSLIKQ